MRLRREGSLGCFEIMLEQIFHEVKIVAEGHCALDEKLERFHNEAKEDHQLAMGLIKHSHDVLKEEMAAGFKTLGDKACLCVDVRRQVNGHDDRIRFLERKSA